MASPPPPAVRPAAAPEADAVPAAAAPFSRSDAGAVVACTKCGRNIAVHLKFCQVCGAPSPARPVNATEQAMREGLLELTRAASAEALKQRPTRAGVMLEAVLIVLSAPLLIPSLIMTFINAKRWGHIPMMLVAIDAFLLLAISGSLKAHWGTSQPPLLVALMFPAVVVACVATGLLVLRRAFKGKLDQGILMGYSDTVVKLMIFGGGLLMLSSLVLYCGWNSTAGQAERVPEQPERWTAPQICTWQGPGYLNVTLSDVSLDLDKRAYRIESNGGRSFSEQNPGKVKALSAHQLLSNPAKYLNAYVSVDQQVKHDGLYVPENWREIARDEDSVPPSTIGRILTKVAVVGRDELWVYSPPIDTEDSKTCLDTKTAFYPTGIVSKLESGIPDMRRLKCSGDRWVITQMGAPTASEIASCAPVSGSDCRLWVAWQGDSAPSELTGIVELLDEQASPSLLALLRTHTPQYQGPVRVLVLTDAAGFRHLRGLPPPEKLPPPPGLDYKWVGALLAGLAMLGLAMKLALNE